MKRLGYTLIEVMVALMIFSILAAMTAGVMHHTFETRDKITDIADRLNTLQMATLLLEREILQAVDRPIRSLDFHVFPPFIGQSDYVEFTRGGVVNVGPNVLQSTLARIAYLCMGDRLIRREWDPLDGADRHQHRDKIILQPIQGCQLSYLATNRHWFPEWQTYALQQNQIKETLPIAIQFQGIVPSWGAFHFIFPIPSARHVF